MTTENPATSRYNGSNGTSCEYCGKEFKPKRGKRFCSTKCRARAWQAKGTTFVSPDGKMVTTVRFK